MPLLMKIRNGGTGGSNPPVRTYTGDMPADIPKGAEFVKIPYGQSYKDVLTKMHPDQKFKLMATYNHETDPDKAGVAYQLVNTGQETNLPVRTNNQAGSGLAKLDFSFMQNASRNRGNSRSVGLRNGGKISRKRLANRAFNK